MGDINAIHAFVANKANADTLGYYYTPEKSFYDEGEYVMSSRMAQAFAGCAGLTGATLQYCMKQQPKPAAKPAPRPNVSAVTGGGRATNVVPRNEKEAESADSDDNDGDGDGDGDGDSEETTTTTTTTTTPAATTTPTAGGLSLQGLHDSICAAKIPVICTNPQSFKIAVIIVGVIFAFLIFRMIMGRR